MKAASLFAGIGGFDLAMHRNGIDVTTSAEIDKNCRGVLARHFPKVKQASDILEVTGADLGEIDILTAGWPCQGNSVAGQRAGMADPRSGLWREAVRLLADARPRFFVGENVPGLLTVNRGADFYEVVKSLDELGYGVAWRVLDAQYFGVPQRRKRVLIVGCLGDGASAAEILFEPDRMCWDSEEIGGAQEGAARGAPVGPITSSAGAHGFRMSAEAAATGHAVVSTLQGGGRRGYRVDAEGAAGGHLLPVPVAIRGRDGGSQIEMGEPGDPAHTVRTPGGGSSHPMVFAKATRAHGPAGSDKADETWVESDKAPSLTSFDVGESRATTIVGTLDAHDGPHGHGGANVQSAYAGHYLPYPADGYNGGVGEPDGPMYPLSTQAVHNRSLVGLPRMGVRRLTPLECERLQGFPDGWTAGQSDSARYRQLGNAVAVPVAEWVIRRVMRHQSAEYSVETSRTSNKDAA